MERLLLSVGQLIQHVTSTEEGRKMIGELANSMLSWLAESMVPAAAEPKAAVGSATAIPTPVTAAVIPPVAATSSTPTRQFPAKYTCLREMSDKIHNEFAVIDSTHGPCRRVAVIYDLIWDIIRNKRGVFVYPKLKKALLDRVDGIIDEIAASPDFTAEERSRHTTSFSDTRHVLNTMGFNPFTWYEADGSRSAAAYAPASGRFIEIRRGNLTGKALSAAGRREWASAAELVEYWQMNNITANSIAYEKK